MPKGRNCTGYPVQMKYRKNHAAFLHHSIKDILDELALDIKKIDAIALANGPGSYTGLRVGLASAKGLCYAFKKTAYNNRNIKCIGFFSYQFINRNYKVINIILPND